MKTVLIIDDINSERQMSSALLTHAGFKVAGTDSAESAWEWLNNNNPPNLILLDIIMPGESGLDFCRKIRSREEWKDIPILFCSSKSEEFDRFWALRQGGTEYITKPYLPQKLIEVVTKYAD
ncbi:MAG: response regulator [Xenococcaceae cyanobacterium MO_207.B15]|nr:response regulator [Xenococcaceae cyanobacterium MO_207.B15]